MAEDLENIAGNGSICSELVESLLARLPLIAFFIFVASTSVGRMLCHASISVVCGPNQAVGNSALFCVCPTLWWVFCSILFLSFMPDSRGVSYWGSTAGMLLVDIQSPSEVRSRGCAFTILSAGTSYLWTYNPLSRYVLIYYGCKIFLVLMQRINFSWKILWIYNIFYYY